MNRYQVFATYAYQPPLLVWQGRFRWRAWLRARSLERLGKPWPEGCGVTVEWRDYRP